MKNKAFTIILIIIIVGAVVYFGWLREKPEEELEETVETEETATEETGEVDPANPASAYCLDQGGELKIKSLAKGERGFCYFPDGSRCEEWDFFNDFCDKGQLKIETIEQGSGEKADEGQTLVVHYVGTLEDGTKFDSSIDRDQPFSLILGDGFLIAGWEQGLLGMQANEKRKLTIKPELAYGEVGAGDIIPANATLIFEIELLEIEN